ncbi:MAG: hypothetical protein QF440_01885 [Candidatus Thalassarchaeaceae archaeon]|nr:hypothetical protein [Candidatus Thalassarchaeaceae archaeon]
MLSQIRRGQLTPILLVGVLLTAIFSGYSPASQLMDDSSIRNDVSGTVSYDLYFATAPGGHPTDGRITTEMPDGGGQEESSASGTTVEFSTDQMLSDIVISGTPTSGGKFELDVTLFLKATGQEGSTVDWTVSVVAGSSIIATEDWSTDACTPSFSGNSCGFDERSFHPEWTGNQDFTVDDGERLKVLVSADMNCNSGGGGDGPDVPNGTESSGRQWGGTECDAWIAYNEIDTASGRFSMIEIETDPVAGSQVKVHRPGSVWTDDEVETWYPNDSPEMRVMQFNLELRDAFGRDDINIVRLNMIDPSGSVAFTHTFDEDELITDNNALRAQYNWTYQGGIDSGDYELDLEVVNIQGKTFTIDHPTVRFNEYGVSLAHLYSRTVEYVSPEETTPISLVLSHIGASGDYSISVELTLMTNLGSNWIEDWDTGDQTYELTGGGGGIGATLSLTAPDDLSNTPDTIDIRAVAYDSEQVLVHQTTLQLDLEFLDTYAPPMVSIWPEAHDNQYANSTGALNLDESIPRYVEDGEFTTFYLEIFNTGFDTDEFRIDVKQDSNANLQFWDNDSGQRIDEDENDGTYHTENLDRHTTQTIRLRVKPSNNRDDPDIGMIELEIMSVGNATQHARVAFTIQRTFGIQAEVVYDCDSTPFGFVNSEICLNTATYLAFDIKITNTMTQGETVTDWILKNPKDLSRNIDDQLYAGANPKYGLWDYEITDTNGDPSPRVQLAPGDDALVNLDITLTQQVEVGNHTIYLRIIEDIEDQNLARYFDLPITIEIGKDDPILSIHQISQPHAMEPDTLSEIQMKVKNDGNSDVMVILKAEADQGWTAEVMSQSGAEVVTVPAFDEVTFTLFIVSSENALNGDDVGIVVSAKPLSEDEAYPDEFTARKTVNVKVSISNLGDLVLSEIFGDRLETKLIGIGIIVLLVAWIVGRRGRVEFIDEWVEYEDDLDMISDEEFDIPDPVGIDDEDSYDDEDIELVDLD